MSIYVYGAIAGLGFGAIVGFLKYLFVWKPLYNKAINPQINEFGQKKDSAASIYIHYFISMAVNILALFLVYYFRRELPFSYAAVLVGTAAALSITSRLYTFRGTKGKNLGEQSKEV